MTGADRRIAVGLFLLAFVAYAYFFNGGGWNQNAHFDLTRALVERGTFHIDGYEGNTGDVARRGTHFYINKPPGASLLAAIPYAPLYCVERLLHAPIGSWQLTTMNAWIVTALTCGVAGALIPAMLYLYLRRRAVVTPRVALIVALATAFGTIVFPYATMLFAHVPAALLLLLAFVWIDERPLLGGAAAGMAGVTLYLCIPAAIVLAIASRKLRFVIGGLPFAIFLAAYQYICFGSPFRTAHELGAFLDEGSFLGVLGRPSLEALHGLTFREYRGLFVVSPVLLLVFVGAFVMIRRRVMLRELAIIFTIAAIFLVANASFNGWHGGSAFGPRYLLPMLPLFAIPLVFVRPPLVIILGILSAMIQLVATAVDPMPPAYVPHPMRMHLLPALAAGKVSINEQSIDELRPNHSHPPGSREATWASFNAGEFLTGAARPVSVLPIVLWMIGGSALLWRRAQP